MKRIIIFVSFALFVLISFSVCRNNSSNNSNKQEEIYNDYSNNTYVRVGIYVYDYPLLYLSNDNLGGLDYDIMNEIAKAENLKLEYIQTQFSELIPSLQNNIIDIAIAGISITEDRKKLVSFSDKYYSSSQSIIVLKDNSEL